MSEALQQLGKDLALSLLGVLRTRDTHGAENMAVAGAPGRLEVVIDAAQAQVPLRRLHHDDRLVRTHGTAHEQVAQLVGQLALRRVGGVAFSAPQTAPQLLRWLVLLNRRPVDEAGFAAMHGELATLAESGIHTLSQRT